MPEPVPQLVLQRIRNRIIDSLQTLSSFDEQRRYAQTVPICYVPYELINGWEDWVDAPRPEHFTDPVFTGSERDAIERFHAAWDEAARALPKDYPPLEEVLGAPYWAKLRGAALKALAIFLKRGRLSEDVEAS